MTLTIRETLGYKRLTVKKALWLRVTLTAKGILSYKAPWLRCEYYMLNWDCAGDKITGPQQILPAGRSPWRCTADTGPQREWAPETPRPGTSQTHWPTCRTRMIHRKVAYIWSWRRWISPVQREKGMHVKRMYREWDAVTILVGFVCWLLNVPATC